MNHLFGPVNSRRLGLSLGIDLLPGKTCSFDCIYCELGPTTHLTCEQQEYIPTDDIMGDIDAFFRDAENESRIDVYTITASGEPTLHSGIGTIIQHLKNKTDKPVVVLTNSSLLHMESVRHALLPADIVIPSLDSARTLSFNRINRPAPEVVLEKIIDGIASLAGEMKGSLWLEILFAKDINDSPPDIEALNQAIRHIHPDRVQVNTVARPPAETYASPLSADRMAYILSCLEGPVDMITDFFEKKEEHRRLSTEREILQLLQRRPCTANHICQAQGVSPKLAADILSSLLSSHKVRRTTHNNEDYFQAN